MNEYNEADFTHTIAIYIMFSIITDNPLAVYLYQHVGMLSKYIYIPKYIQSSAKSSWQNAGHMDLRD